MLEHLQQFGFYPKAFQHFQVKGVNFVTMQGDIILENANIAEVDDL